jgi:hypothetical protein
MDYLDAWSSTDKHAGADGFVVWMGGNDQHPRGSLNFQSFWGEIE